VAVRVRRIEQNVLNMRTRMPFRYGIASMTALPHLFLRIQAEVGGQKAVGVASEGLPPKWFTKDPGTTFRADLADMLAVIAHACETAAQLGAATTVFDLWQELYAEQQRWAVGAGHPPLLASLGASLVERALIDAFCRTTAQPFARAIRNGSLGFRPEVLHEELAAASAADLLPEVPLRTLVARHTVGLADPLTDEEIPAEERLADGLPQSLAACIGTYGLTHFKLKVFGDPAKDLKRLERIARVVEGGGREYAFTLDGNEQFHAVEEFQHFWAAVQAEAGLGEFMRHLIFVEQPLHRDVALSDAAGAQLRAWAERPPIIIDESDGDVDSLPRALAGGYVGTSHKNCKGVFRGVANACLVAQLNGVDARPHPRPLSPKGRGEARVDDHRGHSRYVLSGEDLANVGPVALLQDLAAMATLGVEHVERNGHHYFRGLSMLPAKVQEQVLAEHGDLYRRHTDGFPTLDVRGGRIEVGSVVDAPFGTELLLDVRQFTPLADWRFDDLGVAE
jgi:hypothetical protein